MPKDKKQKRPRAESPRGFRDSFGEEVTRRSEMLDRITDVYRMHGFEALESPAVETVEALGKFLPDVDRPNEGVFAWREEDSGWLALRYDLTAPLARVFAQSRDRLPSPYRRYAVGPVWRNEKPGPGRYRQFYQCDADTVGSSSMAADAEICAMLLDALEAAGIPRDGFVLRLNNRKILNGVMEAASLLDPSDPGEGEETRGIVLRAMDKIDRIGISGVRELLGAGREDESGDFTKGAGLSVGQADLVAAFIEAGSKSSAATCGKLASLVRGSETGLEGVRELEEISELLGNLGCRESEAVVDPSVVRGLGYYTGPVYEAELTLEITGGKGGKKRFGSVAGGGRYDSLVKRFLGQEVPAAGVSIGVDRLLVALAEARDGAGREPGPVVVTVMDKSHMAGYQLMAKELRRGGIRAEVYLGNPKSFGGQLKYADARNSPVAVIEGGSEREKGVVQLKNLALGAEIAKTASLEEWKAQPAQIEVSRDKLVPEVRRMLKPSGA